MRPCLRLSRRLKPFLKDANSIFQMMDARVWSDELGEALRAAVSQSLVVEQPAEDQVKRGPMAAGLSELSGLLEGIPVEVAAPGQQCFNACLRAC